MVWFACINITKVGFILAILGFFFFALSLIGYSSTLRLLHVNPYFTWITSILVNIMFLYIFAMLNLLRFGIWFVTILGFLLLVGRLTFGYLGKVSIQHEYLHLFDAWMIFLGIVMALVLLHSPLIHYDNYSHWAQSSNFYIIMAIYLVPAIQLFLLPHIHLQPPSSSLNSSLSLVFMKERC